MTEVSRYQMAIDLLRCHLGLSEEEAKQQLGLSTEETIPSHIMNMPHSLVGLSQEK
ncbi:MULTISPECIES: hypothetical protein [Vibrio]|uniref:hypothetical protein n=1 Tax=Vibrio TaxID=662 RepID=UPI000C165B42|nr:MULTISPECIES: hypothetical protein [Vibrio]